MKNIDIALVACADNNNGLGKDGKLLFSIPEDMKYFKTLTKTHGGCILMGRKTAESLPGGKQLPDRTNIVLTRTRWKKKGFVSVGSIQEALQICLQQQASVLWVVGGQSIYESCIHSARFLHITHVHSTKNADTFFPAICSSKWERETPVTTPASKTSDGLHYIFVTYRRRE